MTLVLASLSKSFGGFRAVDDVGFQVPEGGLVGVIGPNGAGKSTLFSLISGFLAPDRGTVSLFGEDVTRLAAHERARRGMVRTFQVPREYAHLTVRENLLAAVPDQSGETLRGLFLRPAAVRIEEEEARARVAETIGFLGLAPVAETPAGRLSGGQKKLLELGRALMTNPKLILLDEPFAGVNPVLVAALSDHVRALNGRGIGLLIIEHDLPALTRLVSVLHVMDRGRIIASGTPEAVLSAPEVREAYLGGVS